MNSTFDAQIAETVSQIAVMKADKKRKVKVLNEEIKAYEEALVELVAKREGKDVKPQVGEQE
jgi:hypothetical protein